jgi:hypothetical protein
VTHYFLTTYYDILYDTYFRRLKAFSETEGLESLEALIVTAHRTCMDVEYASSKRMTFRPLPADASGCDKP